MKVGMLIYNGIVINLKALLIESFTNFMQNCQFVKRFLLLYVKVCICLHQRVHICSHGYANYINCLQQMYYLYYVYKTNAFPNNALKNMQLAQPLVLLN